MARNGIDTARARETVQQLSGIAREVTPLAERFFRTVGGINRPADEYVARRFENTAFLRSFLRENANEPAIVAARAKIEGQRRKNEPTGNLIVGETPLQPVNPALFDRYETADLTLRALFQIEDPQKRDALVRLIQQQTDQSTTRNLEAIDSGEAEPKDIVIVGGGLLTSVASTLLAHSGARITVISESELGEPWLSRPFNINSSVQTVFGGVNLPLLEGTTPITPSFQNNAVSPDALLGLSGEVLTVPCRDPQRPTREYIAGTGLGQLAAVNIVGATNDVITGQRVDPTKLRVNANGTKTLTIIDSKTGQERTLDTKTVVFLSGPGQERFGIQDTETQKAYEEGALKLRMDIATAQERVDRINERLATLKGYVESADEIGRLEEMRDLITIPLPKILSLTLVQEAYGFWVRNGRRGPSPLEPLWGLNTQGNKPVSIGIAGGGDSALVEAEIALGLAPNSAYPIGFDRSGINTQVTIYNPPSDETEDFRTRYQRTAGDPRVTLLPGFKVKKGTETDDAISVIATKAVDGTEIEQSQNNRHDYLFVSTGLEQSTVPQQLRQVLGDQFGEVIDLSFRRTALGNADLGVIVAGSATNFTAKDFPSEVQALIQALGIRENTISVWVNSLLLQQTLLSLGIRGQLPIERSTLDVRPSVSTQPVRPEEAALVESLSASLGITEESSATFPQAGLFIGAFDQNRRALSGLARERRTEQSSRDPEYIVSVLEAVGNTLVENRRLDPRLMTIGAREAIISRDISELLRNLGSYSTEQQIEVLYGYFAGALAVANPRAIGEPDLPSGALFQIGLLQNRPIREVIQDVLPVIVAVRQQRPDLNVLGSRLDGRDRMPIDDYLRGNGFFWNPQLRTFEFVDVRSFPTDVNDSRVAGLLQEGRQIVDAISPPGLETRIMGMVTGEAKRTALSEGQQVVNSYVKGITRILIAQAITNPDLLFDEISPRRLEGLGTRIRKGAEEGIRGGTQGLDTVLRFGSYSPEQFADFWYGYFAGGLARGNPGIVNALEQIALLRARQNLQRLSREEAVVAVIKEVLPFINRARQERPDLLIERLGNGGRLPYVDQTYIPPFPIEKELERFGFRWNGTEYVRK